MEFPAKPDRDRLEQPVRSVSLVPLPGGQVSQDPGDFPLGGFAQTPYPLDTKELSVRMRVLQSINREAFAGFDARLRMEI